MANWILYPVDRGVRRTLTQCYDSVGSGTGINASNGRPNHVWQPGSATTVYLWFNLGATYSIGAVGLSNHNLSSKSIRAGKVGSMGSTTFTSYYDFTPADNNDIVAVFSPAISGSIFCVRFTAATTSYVGEVSWLDDGTKIDTGGYGPRWPIDRSVQELGYVSMLSAGGGEITQGLGGIRQGLTLALSYLPSGASSLADTIESSLRSYDGWSDGVWVTSDEFGDPTALQGRGYYCTLGGPPTGAIGDAGGRMVFTLPLVEKSHGLRVPA